MFSALVRRVVLTVASLVLLTFAGDFFGEVSGEQQYAPVITRSVNYRTPTLHPTGRDVVTRNSLVRIGGVLSQADSLTDGSGNPVSVRIELAPNRPYTGYVNVHRTGSSMPPMWYRYPITYEDLVPMALFVDSGGTSLYTLWDSGSDRFPPNFERDAGFVNHHVRVVVDGAIVDVARGLIAVEFQRTRYSHAVYSLDTCPNCVGAADDDLVTRINAALIDERSDDTRVIGSDVQLIDGTWLNTDLYLPFRVTTNDHLLSVDGNVVRLYPRVEQNRVVIRDARRVVTPVTPDNYVASEVFLSDVGFLFETLALLRSVKESSPDDWERFREALASEVLVNANPEPWRRYSRSFCSLYGDEEDCRNWR